MGALKSKVRQSATSHALHFARSLIDKMPTARILYTIVYFPRKKDTTDTQTHIAESDECVRGALIYKTTIYTHTKGHPI